MIIGIGLDLIEVGRIQKALQKERFAHKVFSEKEQQTLAERSWNAQSAAGAFAAKEAVSKALGTGFGTIGWQEISILHDEFGRPQVELAGRALERFQLLGGQRLHISITHLSGLAAAQAILEG